jgi:hypothetical protein
LTNCSPCGIPPNGHHLIRGSGTSPRPHIPIFVDRTMFESPAMKKELNQNLFGQQGHYTVCQHYHVV